MRIDPVTLVLDLGSLKSGSSTETVRLPMHEIDWEIADIVPASPEGVLEISVTARDRTWVCRGTLTVEFETPCARCLEPALFPVDADVFRVFTQDPELADDLDTELIPRNEGAVSILDAVREAVILSVPGMPLCRTDCRGLCAECGANLNSTGCEHSGSAPDGSDPSERE
jgi:uncharacterized protein